LVEIVEALTRALAQEQLMVIADEVDAQLKETVRSLMERKLAGAVA
jgi:hypothetical protein